MGKTYRIESFVYQGRSDGSNGRIKEYEIAFSNHPKVWGSPALRGQFANTSAIQTVAVPSKPEARYFKLLACSEVENRNWASAAELGIEASAVVADREEICAAPASSKTYYIKHTASDLYLQYKKDASSNYEGDFCLNTLNRTDKNFCYTFIPVSGFAGLYCVRAEGQAKYLNKYDSDSWRIVLGSKTDNSGRFRMEFQNDCQTAFRAGWQQSQYVNLDRTTSGSYIYADKSTGALWRLEEENSNVIEAVETASKPAIYPNPTGGKLHILTSGDSVVKIMDFSGRLLKSCSSGGDITVDMPYPDGIYVVGIMEKDEVFTQKIVLNKLNN
jgi:beta-galactosidase